MAVAAEEIVQPPAQFESAAQADIESLRRALTAVLSNGHAAVGRLSYAHTSVRFSISGTGGAVTLLADRSPPVIANGDEAAEVEIEFTPDQAVRFVQGRLRMTGELEIGALRAAGPLRHYLEIDPILRGALRDRAGGDGRACAASGPVSPLRPDLLAVETRNLHKSFGPNEVLRGIDLTIPEGVISIILGPSGTGKSVLLNHVIGLTTPDSGDVLVRERSLTRMSRSEILALRLEIGVMFQDGALFSALNLYDNIAFPLRQHTDMHEDEIREVVMHHLMSVGLASAVEAHPDELSGGMRKRAGLARALVLDPGIILCDEPDSGLDPVRAALLGDLLAQQHAEKGGTMVVITHNVALARGIGEHISIVWRGKIVESGSAERVFASENPFIRQFLQSETEGPLSMDA